MGGWGGVTTDLHVIRVSHGPAAPSCSLTPATVPKNRRQTLAKMRGDQSTYPHLPVVKGGNYMYAYNIS